MCPAASRSRRQPPKLHDAVEIGRRTFLRLPREEDFAEYMKLRRDSADFLLRWEPKPPGNRSPFSGATFDRLLALARSAENRKFLICRIDDGAILGQISLNNITRGPHQNAMLGYWIGKPFARQGYMTEAINLALCHAFRTLKLHRVEANIIPRNKPSIALIKRCGFRPEGLSKRYLQINGRWEDHTRWAMTVEEWR